MSQQIYVVSTAKREDGGLRAWSDDLPGLILSGESPDWVRRSIPWAVEALLRHAGEPIHSVTLADWGSPQPHTGQVPVVVVR